MVERTNLKTQNNLLTMDIIIGITLGLIIFYGFIEPRIRIEK